VPRRDLCAWQAAGRPAYDGPARKVQDYAGTDRQCRGRLLAVRARGGRCRARVRLDAVWAIADQREQRVLDLALDRAAQRPGAQRRVVALLGEQLLGASVSSIADVVVLSCCSRSA
jgi:hypothetical protein